jgi:hypothetical protein
MKKNNKLNGLPSAMNDQQFDKVLKDKLNAVEPPYDAGSWDLLAQKLDAPLTPEYPESVADVDKAVYRPLQHLESPFEPAHWSAMEQRLNRERRKTGVLWLKLAEAAIFVLAAAYIGGWLDEDAFLKAPIRANGPVAFLYENGVERGALPVAVIQPTAAVRRSTGVVRVESLHEPELFTGAQHSGAGSILRDIFTSPADERRIPVENTAFTRSQEAGSHAAQLPVAYPVFLQRERPALTARETADKITGVTQRRRHFYTLALVSAERNEAVAGSYTHLSSGYTAGYGVGYRQGRWGIEVGAQYANRNYDPKKSVVLFDGNTSGGYYGVNLRTVEADLLSIPVKAIRRVWKAGKTEVHAVAGATAHLALQKSYKYETIYFPGQPPSTLPVLSADQQDKLRPKANGLLEGGRAAGNTYLTADAGIRVEYPISTRFTAFIEPTYRRAFGNGIGPQASRINTMAVSAGVITTI